MSGGSKSAPKAAAATPAKAEPAKVAAPATPAPAKAEPAKMAAPAPARRRREGGADQGRGARGRTGCGTGYHDQVEGCRGQAGTRQEVTQRAAASCPALPHGSRIGRYVTGRVAGAGLSAETRTAAARPQAASRRAWRSRSGSRDGRCRRDRTPKAGWWPRRPHARAAARTPPPVRRSAGRNARAGSSCPYTAGVRTPYPRVTRATGLACVRRTSATIRSAMDPAGTLPARAVPGC